MKAKESIRMNVAVHPEKDPILFNLLRSVSSKEARTRRLINLATMGILMENGNTPVMAPTPVSNNLAGVLGSESAANNTLVEIKEGSSKALNDNEIDHFSNFS